MQIGDLVRSYPWAGQMKRKYGVITEIQGSGFMVSIQWTDGTTAMLSKNWFEVVSTGRDR
jgi:hypothetical protein